MSARIHAHDGDIYLTGAGATGSLRWRRDGDRWQAEPAALPDGARRIDVAQLPDDLREELLAFAVRADAMGAATQAAGN